MKSKSPPPWGGVELGILSRSVQSRRLAIIPDDDDGDGEEASPGNGHGSPAGMCSSRRCWNVGFQMVSQAAVWVCDGGALINKTWLIKWIRRNFPFSRGWWDAGSGTRGTVRCGGESLINQTIWSYIFWQTNKLVWLEREQEEVLVGLLGLDWDNTEYYMDSSELNWDKLKQNWKVDSKLILTETNRDKIEPCLKRKKMRQAWSN